MSPEPSAPDPVRIVLPGPLQALANGRPSLDLPAPAAVTVGQALEQLQGPYPVLVRRILDETGQVRRHVNIYLDGQDIRALDRLGTPVPPGGELLVIQAISGG